MFSCCVRMNSGRQEHIFMIFINNLKHEYITWANQPGDYKDRRLTWLCVALSDAATLLNQTWILPGHMIDACALAYNKYLMKHVYWATLGNNIYYWNIHNEVIYICKLNQ